MSATRVGTCRPQMTGGWLCLLECGCQVFADVKRRPRTIEGHVCIELEPPAPVQWGPPEQLTIPGLDEST